MELVVFTVVAAGLYLLADRLLRGLEAALGRPLEHRSLIFFVLLLGLALGGFTLIRTLAGS